MKKRLWIVPLIFFVYASGQELYEVQRKILNDSTSNRQKNGIVGPHLYSSLGLNNDNQPISAIQLAYAEIQPIFYYLG